MPTPWTIGLGFATAPRSKRGTPEVLLFLQISPIPDDVKQYVHNWRALVTGGLSTAHISDIQDLFNLLAFFSVPLDEPPIHGVFWVFCGFLQYGGFNS